MATKAPIYLKRGSRKGKKEKLRDILSSDMISPPLGDFRHTIHIGGQGDTFGDISFLQGNFHLLLPRGHRPRDRDWHRDSAEEEPPFEFSRTATVSGVGEPPSAASPLLKNAISLPALGAAQAITLPLPPVQTQPPAQTPAPALTLPQTPEQPPASALTLPQLQAQTPTQELTLPPVQTQTLPQAQPPAPPKPPRLHLAEPPGSPAVSPPCPRADPAASPAVSPPCPRAEPSLAGSLLSLQLDLGPSMLEDVLRVMDRHRRGQGGVLT